MEENNNIETNNSENSTNEPKSNKNICFQNNCWKMCLGMVVAAFVGGFLATYVVADQIMERQYQRPVTYSYNSPDKMLDEMDEVYQREIQDFENYVPRMNRMFHHAFGMPNMTMPNGVGIRTFYNDDSFNVSVCLKNLNFDEDKVQYKLKGNKLKVYGENEIDEDGYSSEVSFSQDYMLPSGADVKHIRKYRVGNRVIISVPLKR